METATQTLHRLTSYEPGRDWDEPIDDPRVLQDLVVNDVDRLPWFYKRYEQTLPRVPLPRDLPPTTAPAPAIEVLAGTRADNVRPERQRAERSTRGGQLRESQTAALRLNYPRRGVSRAVYLRPVITLRDLQDSDREAVLALRVAPDQRRFVSTVPESLAEAAAEPGAQAISWAIYRDETPVGFVMIADEVEEPYISHYLWKLLIDERCQRQGVGTAALDLVVRYFLDRPGVDSITTSASEGEGSPIPFYERYGFERTGEMDDQEVALRLDLRKYESLGRP